MKRLNKKLQQYAHAAMRFVRLAAKALWYDVTTAKWKAPIVVVVTLLALYLYGLSAAVLWCIFVVYLLYEYDNRYLGAVAILCLISCPVLLALYMDDVAEQMAVYAFFFLVMTVTLQLIDYKRHPETYADEPVK